MTYYVPKKHSKQAAFTCPFRVPAVEDWISTLRAERDLLRDHMTAGIEQPKRGGGRSRYQGVDPGQNLVGFGIGWAQVRGRLLSPLIPCVRVYVRKKLPEKAVEPRARVPKYVVHFPTDIVEVTGPIQTLHAGHGACHCQDMECFGTVCCYVRDKKNPRPTKILGCDHVFNPDGLAKAGDEILSPPIVHGGIASYDACGRFERSSGKFDAAVAQVRHEPRDIVIRGLGRVTGEPPNRTAKLQWQQVQSHGRGTNARTFGVIADWDFSYTGSDSPHILITPESKHRPYAKPGDSGALVATRHQRPRPVAMVVNRLGRFCVAVSLRDLATDLGVEILTSRRR